MLYSALAVCICSGDTAVCGHGPLSTHSSYIETSVPLQPWLSPNSLYVRTRLALNLQNSHTFASLTLELWQASAHRLWADLSHQLCQGGVWALTHPLLSHKPLLFQLQPSGSLFSASSLFRASLLDVSPKGWDEPPLWVVQPWQGTQTFLDLRGPSKHLSI